MRINIQHDAERVEPSGIDIIHRWVAESRYVIVQFDVSTEEEN